MPKYLFGDVVNFVAKYNDKNCYMGKIVGSYSLKTSNSFYTTMIN